MGDGCAQALTEKLAAELNYAGVQLETLALQLCLDPVVFDRHAATLQQFDHLSQILGEVVRLLRCPGSQQEALATLRLDAMRGRMAAP